MTATNTNRSQQPAKRASAQLNLPAHPASILLADDEHLVATGLASNLQDLGYRVVGPAGDGDEAVELARSSSADLALLDIRMGERSGLEAAEVLFHELGVPVIILSAYSDPSYVEEGIRIGVFGYLLKPVTQDQLHVAISVSWGRFLDHVSQIKQIDQLKERLVHRKIIEQAKWIIVKRKSISEPEAMKVLQMQARSTRRPLIDVANALVQTDQLLRD